MFLCQGKKLFHFAFNKPLISYPFFDVIIEFVANRWKERKNFFTNYKMIYLRPNQNMKWKSDNMFLEKKKKKDVFCKKISDIRGNV